MKMRESGLFVRRLLALIMACALAIAMCAGCAGSTGAEQGEDEVIEESADGAVEESAGGGTVNPDLVADEKADQYIELENRYYELYAQGNYEEAFAVLVELYDKYGKEEHAGLLGTMYYEGQGTDKDYEKALFYFETGAVSDPYSMYRASQMYFNGEGTDLDLKKSLEYAQKAKEAGVEEAVPGVNIDEWIMSIENKISLEEG